MEGVPRGLLWAMGAGALIAAVGFVGLSNSESLGIDPNTAGWVTAGGLAITFGTPVAYMMLPFIAMIVPPRTEYE